jgi:hypothetical protein
MSAVTALSALVLCAGCSAGGSRPTVGASGTPSAHRSSTSAGAAGAIGPIPSVTAALPAIERFVENERGLHFKHPVKATLLGTKAFLNKLDKGDDKPHPKQDQEEVATLSSLGLISPRVDIEKVFKTADDDGTLGFYNAKSKRLYVRGTKATPGVRAVLAHELTHALTDQWFGINRPRLNKDHQELSLAFTALIEGDAERTRIDYQKQILNPAQRALAKKEEAGTGGTPHVPLIVLELIGFPYEVGPPFVRGLVSYGGLSALNHAYRHPPVSSEQLLDPTAYLLNDKPRHVATPHADGTRVDHGDLGVIGLLLMLEHGLPTKTALSAVHGWGGDQYAAWLAGPHRYCLRDSVVMDNSHATSTFDAALKRWVATTGGAARIEASGGTTTFLTCSS